MAPAAARLAALQFAQTLPARCWASLPPPASSATRLQHALATRAAGMTRRSARGAGRGESAAPPSAATAAAVDSLLSQMPTLPKLVVFDLDYTAWPTWCEMHSPSDTPRLYPDVPAILDGLERAGVQMAIASRTPTPHVASAWLDKLELRSRFCSIQLIPASSGWDHSSAQKDTAHFPAIQRETGHGWEEMLFFDDEGGNVRKVSRLGVTSILVDTSTGVSLAALERGLRAFAEARQQQAPS